MVHIFSEREMIHLLLKLLLKFVFSVDEGAILDLILDNFVYASPMGFEKIMVEQSLL